MIQKAALKTMGMVEDCVQNYDKLGSGCRAYKRLTRLTAYGILSDMLWRMSGYYKDEGKVRNTT